MGASESTANSNGTREEEDTRQENNRSMGTATAIAIAAAGVAVAAWGISRMIATAAAGVAVAAWGISRMLSDNIDAEERNHQVAEPLLLNSPRIIYEGLNQRTIWSAPSPGRYKMNTDGSCRPTPTGHCGYGGILRDHHGKWVQGFIGYIGVNDSLTSEFNGILKGLKLLDDHNRKGAVLETDCKAAHEWVTRQGDDRRKTEVIEACWSIINECRQLKDKNDIEIILVRGENANQCADALAAMAVERRDELEAIAVETGEAYLELEFNYLPLEIKKLVAKDAKVNG